MRLIYEGTRTAITTRDRVSLPSCKVWLADRMKSSVRPRGGRPGGGRCDMAIATIRIRFGGAALAVIAAVGLMTDRALADDPDPARTLREKGLVRSGATYVVKEADGLKDRIAEIDRRFEEWKREKAGLDEQLDTLGRLRVEHQEIMKKLRALTFRRPDTKDFGPRRFPDDGPRGPDSGPGPNSGRFQPGSGPPPPPPDEMGGFGPALSTTWCANLDSTTLAGSTACLMPSGPGSPSRLSPRKSPVKILLKSLKGSFKQSKIAASRPLPLTRKFAPGMTD